MNTDVLPPHHRCARARSGRRSLCLVALVGASIAVVSIAYGIDDVELAIDSIKGPAWEAQGLDATVELSSSGARASLRLEVVRLAQLPDPIRNVVIDCADLEISQEAFVCRKARVVANVPLIGKQTLDARARYERATGGLELDLTGVKLGSGTARVHAALREERWSARIALDTVPLDTLLELTRVADVPLPVVAAAGATSMEVNVEGRQGEVARLRAKGTFEQLTANNESGSFATDGMGMRFDVALARSRENWTYEANVVANRGQGYAEPIFLDFGAHAFELTARGTLEEADRLTAEHFEVAHAGVMSAQGRGVLDLAQEQPIRDLDVAIDALRFPAAYDTYMQPLLLETDFQALRTTGGLTGEISIASGKPRAMRFSFEEVSIEGDQPSLALHGLTGEWNWTAEGSEDIPSELAWSAGGFYGLELGAGRLRFASVGTDFELLSPTRMGLFDGALEIETLSVQRAGAQDVAFRVDATIHPISVSRLCKAFGWPEFGGRVGGAITNLQLQEGVLTLGTTLEAQVFDGVVTVRDLRLDEPFGNWPRLYANIDLDSLDLELVTSAFSFGRITGRLSGGIHALELFNWSPIAFDARLFTPANDRSRRRISQRAVQNIGSIGGGGAGVTAALSSGFLRFFEDFSYARLGITCKLENEICQMGGVAPAPNGGYYLVQGRGLPRIDVIGNARRVDWPRLVQQLIAATESGGPVVD